MVHDMKDSGEMIYKMGKEEKCGWMDPIMRGSIKEERNRDGVFTSGMMGAGMMANGRRTKLKEWELTHGLMVGSTKESGWIITWKVMAFILGQMGACMKDLTKTTRSMVLEFIHGLTTDSTRVGGLRASSTV